MRSKKILIVDDEPQTRSALSLAIEYHGHKAITAANGECALQLITRLHHGGRPIDLIISDMQMPKMNGEQLIERMNMLNIYIPFLAITAFGEKEQVVRLREKGCRDFIVKPFSMEHVVGRINNILLADEQPAIKKNIEPLAAMPAEYAEPPTMMVKKIDAEPIQENRFLAVFPSSLIAPQNCRNIPNPA